jgi:hypothetical protein
MLGGAPISQAFPSSSRRRSAEPPICGLLDDDDANSILDTMNLSEPLTHEVRSSKSSKSSKKSKKSKSMRAAPMQPIDPDVYLAGGGAPLQPSTSNRKRTGRPPRSPNLIPADGGDMGFTSSSGLSSFAAELSSFSSPFGGAAEEEEIDFYQDDEEDVDDRQERKAAAAAAKATKVETEDDEESDDDDSIKDARRSPRETTSSASIDLGIYIISGLFLILILEQFIQLGMRMR